MATAMESENFESALARGVEILSEFLPLHTYLYFPILYSACVWAIRRVFDYKERILTWQVWLEADAIQTKPDEFIFHFFKTHDDLCRIYAEEIEARDSKTLRRDFAALYPLCGLEDAFLKALFKADLDAGAFRKIAEEFPEKAARAKRHIEAVEKNRFFWRFLESFGMEIAFLSVHLLKDEDVQNLIIDAVKKKPPADSENP